MGQIEVASYLGLVVGFQPSQSSLYSLLIDFIRHLHNYSFAITILKNPRSENSMTTIYATHPRYTEHDYPGHPEHAGRIRTVWKQLQATGLDSQMESVIPQPVSTDLIKTVHTEEYLNILQWISTSGQNNVRLDADTYALPTSYEVARLSAGGVISVVDAVLSGQASNGLAAVRPPGHHAMPDHGMGFCLLGNIALGARHAQNNYGLKKVLIVDFDVHHGNGTQAMFYNDNSVFFISSHQYPFYPGSGAFDETGKGIGSGYTLNIPLAPGHGDESLAAIYESVVWPATERFQPDLIMVSAGFDAHWDDPLAALNLSLTGYDHITRELIRMAQKLCDGKIIFVMEGGYNLNVLAHGIENIAHALLGQDIVNDPFGESNMREPAIKPIIKRIQEIHKL